MMTARAVLTCQLEHALFAIFLSIIFISSMIFLIKRTQWGSLAYVSGIRPTFHAASLVPILFMYTVFAGRTILRFIVDFKLPRTETITLECSFGLMCRVSLLKADVLRVIPADMFSANRATTSDWKWWLVKHMLNAENGKSPQECILTRLRLVLSTDCITRRRSL